MNMIEFAWVRSRGAFQIQLTGSGEKASVEKRRGWKPGPPGVPWLTTDGKKWFEVYRPTEFPTLFRKFADTPHSPEGMQDFFNVFGPLAFGHFGLTNRSGNPVSPAAGLSGLSLSLDEPLRHHAVFCRAVEFWESGDLSTLTDVFNKRGWAQVRAELRPRPSGKVEIAFIPTSLIHFIWLQFALFVAGAAKLLRCERCSEPMIVGPGTGRRETSKFCTNACKVATFKERHNHA